MSPASCTHPISTPTNAPVVLSLSTADAARAIGVSPKTLRNWRASAAPKGPRFVRLDGGTVLYRVVDIDEWLASRVAE